MEEAVRRMRKLVDEAREFISLGAS